MTRQTRPSIAAGEVEIHRNVRRLILAYSDAVSPALNLDAGLDAFCHAADALFGAARTSVWLHERRHRQLRRAASSDLKLERHVAVATTDRRIPAARGFRRATPTLTPRSVGSRGRRSHLVVIPLKGRRRALGAIVVEAVRRDGWRADDIAAHATELGQQMSAALENLLLLHDVIHSRQELENTFNSIPDLIAVCDRRLQLVHVNNAFADRVGLDRDALDGRELADFLGDDLRAWLTRADLDKRTAPASLGPLEIADAALGGSFSVTVTRLMSPAGGAVGLVLVARDISDRVRLEAERTALRDRLAQAEKLAALGHFVAGIAHELNNPLQAILGHADLLAATATLPDEMERDVRTVTREAERAAQVIRNLLVFAGSRTRAKRRISLNAVVRRALATRRRACRSAGITVAANLSSAGPRVMGDPRLLQQAVVNLLTNAEQAVDRGSRRRVSVSTRVDTRRSMVTIRVRDSGEGIVDTALPHVFEPFYTTREVGDGTGLGLAITYGVVREHGGEITAANEQHGGAAFTVRLPWLRRRVTSSARIATVRPVSGHD